MPQYSNQRKTRNPLKRRAKAYRKVGRKTNMLYKPMSSCSKYFFKRYLASGALSTTNGFLLDGLSWSLNDVVNVSEFSSLFDQYKICGVRMDFIWRSSSISQIETRDNNLVGMPIMHHVIDLDDNTAPATISELNQYGKVKKFYFGTNRRVYKIFFKPRYRNLIDATSGTAYTLGDRHSWLDITNGNVDHYGFKFAIEVPQAGGTKVEAYVDVETQLYLQFRQTR